MQQKNRILFFMVIAMVLGYLPWYNFSAVLPYLSEEFGLTGSNTGTILAAFQIGYVLVVLTTGRLADIWGTKKVVFWATFFTGIFSTAFIFIVNGFYSILAMRLLTGLSAGAIYAPGIALLSNWFGPTERGKAIGAYTAALTLAYGGGYFIAAPLAAAYGWRMGMLWTSLPVFIAAILLWFFVAEKPRELNTANVSPGLIVDIQEAALQGQELKPYECENTVKQAPEGGYKGPVIITVSYMGHMWELYAFWGWIGPFMVANALAAGYAHWEATALGGRLAAFIILLGVPSVWILGYIADHWGRTKTIILAATCSLAAQFFFGYLYGKSLTLVVIVGLWIGFWVIADSGIYKAGLTDMVAPQIRATSLGIQSAAGYSMTVLAPWVFGVILDALNKGANPTEATNWGIPFLVLGVGALLAPVCAIILRRLPQAALMAKGRK
ncbi:MAG: MFS transporter [Bacillota bacterium]